MSRLLVTTRSLDDRRRSLAWWAVGLFLYTAMIIAVWPTLEDNADFQQLADDYPEGLKAMFGGADAFALLTTPAGFLNTYVFSMIFPLFLVGLGVAMGSALLAGDEESGLLDLLLSTPVTRARAVGEKALAVTLAILGMGVVLVVVVYGLGLAVGLDVGFDLLLAAALGSLLFGLLHGLVALLAGAWSGSKGFAAGAAWGVALGGYLLNVLANLTDSLDPLKWGSPLYYATANDPILNGVPAEYLLLAAACALAFVATLVVFQRHDLS
jgi:ABC-2 type transport system permease protein